MLADAPIRWTDPTTWPWMVYVWLAFLLLGWAKPAWNWFRRKRAASWPIAEGRIESIEITKPRFSLSTKRGYYVAELGYSYSVAGTPHWGRNRRAFPTEAEAAEFGRDLQGKPVAVHYDANAPLNSSLLEPDVEALLRNRAPADESVTALGSVPEWTRPFLWFFAALSAIGLVLSLWVQVMVLTGGTPSPISWVLHIGTFVVWFPAVFVAQRMVGNVSRRDLWKVVLRGAPDWMKYLMYCLFAYNFVAYLFFMSKAPSGRGGPSSPASMWLGFSATWMVFYSAALAILYSAAHAVDKGPRCINGHVVPAQASFCAQCGQPVLRTR